MAYLPKLNPTVGGGLGGLPTRAAGGAGVPVRGEVIFTLSGSSTWIVPEGVTSICAVCVGSGSGSSFDIDNNNTYVGGAGGGLAWVNDIAVTVGDSLSMFIGQRGFSVAQSTFTYAAASAIFNGGEARLTVGGTIVCRASGGYISSGLVGTGGVALVGTGGSGGSTTSTTSETSGGGAGGYSGNGANGITGTTSTAGGAGSGGGGGSGAISGNVTSSAGGGGVGLFGEGASGGATGVPSNLYEAFGGNGGSGGESGTSRPPTVATSNSRSPLHAGNYGGGAGCSAGLSYAGGGAIRILWGKGRAFPSTDVGQS